MTLWEVTIAEALQSIGYATGLFGKWHLGGDRPENRNPSQQGFDEYYGIPRTSNEAQTTIAQGGTAPNTSFIWEGRTGSPPRNVKPFDLQTRRTVGRDRLSESVHAEPLLAVRLDPAHRGRAEPEEIGRLIAACRESFAIASDAEVTLETNPETVTTARMRGFRAAGVNHLDTWVRRGVPGHTFPLPMIPGCDGAGVVDAIGPGVASRLT